jgi:excisionase family DNA binding protein
MSDAPSAASPVSSSAPPSKPVATESDDWLTVEEVATDIYKCGRKLIYREIAAGRLRAARIGGRRGPVRIRRSWAHASLEASAEPVEVRR